jgi:hypothetical protein
MKINPIKINQFLSVVGFLLIFWPHDGQTGFICLEEKCWIMTQSEPYKLAAKRLKWLNRIDLEDPARRQRASRKEDM